MTNYLTTILLGGEPAKHLRVVEVQDDKLSSKFRRGDRAVIDVTDLSLREGYIACDFSNEGVIQFFRLQATFDPDRPYQLLADCPHHIPQRLTRERLQEGLLGRVVGALVRI